MGKEQILPALGDLNTSGEVFAMEIRGEQAYNLWYPQRILGRHGVVWVSVEFRTDESREGQLLALLDALALPFRRILKTCRQPRDR